MSKPRLFLVLILLATDGSIAYSQLLPRRREATGRAIEQGVQKQAFEWAGQVIAKAAGEAIQEIFAYLELDSSLQLFALIQMDPTIQEKLDKEARSTVGWIETTTPGVWGYWIGDKCTAVHERDGSVYAVDERNMPTNRKIDPPAPWPGARGKAVLLKELMTKGSAKVFLTETARFAEKLTSDKFTPPVLEKINLECEGDEDCPSFSQSPEFGTIRRRILKDDIIWEENDLPNKEPDKRAVTFSMSHKKKDPQNKTPLTIHCSFVFATQKESKDYHKTLSFDLYLEKLKPQDGTEFSYPWKVKNVLYK